MNYLSLTLSPNATKLGQVNKVAENFFLAFLLVVTSKFIGNFFDTLITILIHTNPNDQVQ
jgi:hypothetical protein